MVLFVYGGKKIFLIALKPCPLSIQYEHMNALQYRRGHKIERDQNFCEEKKIISKNKKNQSHQVKYDSKSEYQTTDRRSFYQQDSKNISSRSSKPIEKENYEHESDYVDQYCCMLYQPCQNGMIHFDLHLVS